MKNVTVVKGSFGFVTLTNGFVAIVSKKDVPLISRHRWYAKHDKRRGLIYAATNVRGGKRYTPLAMHRLLLGLSNSKIQGEHKDGNGLNNRRRNLRRASVSQNVCNTGLRSDNKTGFKGVHTQGDKYRARITFAKHVCSLGLFNTAEEAARAYDHAAKRLHGKFARLNFPEAA